MTIELYLNCNFFFFSWRRIIACTCLLCSAVMTAHTLLNLDPRDAEPPPSTLQPTQSFLETAGKSLTLYMIGSSRLHREMSETSRVEIDELPASIPWIVFDKARTVVKLFHTRSVVSQFPVTRSCSRMRACRRTGKTSTCQSWVWRTKSRMVSNKVRESTSCATAKQQESQPSEFKAFPPWGIQ